MLSLKIVVSPGNKIKAGDYRTHAEMLHGVDYDSYVRAAYWLDFNAIYFRFYAPLGYYDVVDERDKAMSFDRCSVVLGLLKRKKIVPKKVRVSFWDEGLLYKWGIRERF